VHVTSEPIRLAAAERPSRFRLACIQRVYIRAHESGVPACTRAFAPLFSDGKETDLGRESRREKAQSRGFFQN